MRSADGLLVFTENDVEQVEKTLRNVNNLKECLRGVESFAPAPIKRRRHGHVSYFILHAVYRRILAHLIHGRFCGQRRIH